MVIEEHVGATSMKKFESTYEQITRESKAVGKAEGKAEGHVEGAAQLLQTLLRRRFGKVPATVAARIAAGSLADLDRWAERVLEARTLGEVFAD
jgi:predicted transposase YdaD